MENASVAEQATHWWTWKDLCEDPRFRDLPFKLELNHLNQLIVAPPSYRHSRRQMKICLLLARLLKGGEASAETAVRTTDNVKVPDAVWASRGLIRRHKEASELPVAPEICVEVLSPTNSTAEIDEKRALYFEAGAREVWVCDLGGALHFLSPAGPLERSAMCPKFPARIKL